MFKILMITASRGGELDFQITQEINQLRKYCRENHQLECAIEQAVPYTELDAHIKEHQPDLLYFCGHGKCETDESFLRFQDGEPVSATTFTAFINNLNKNLPKKIRFILLNACESEGTAKKLAGVIEVAIGHRGEVGEFHCLDFASGFLKTWLWGWSFQAAFTNGRLNTERLEDDSIPIMFHGANVDPEHLTINECSRPLPTLNGTIHKKQFLQPGRLSVKANRNGQLQILYRYSGGRFRHVPLKADQSLNLHLVPREYTLLYESAGMPTLKQDIVVKRGQASCVSFKCKLPLLPPKFPRIEGKELDGGLWMAHYPVTQDQWFAVMGTCPWQIENGQDSVRPEIPAVGMDWDDARLFATRLGHKDVTRDYRLPNEQEWDKACRAGTWADEIIAEQGNKLAEFAWYQSEVTSGAICPSSIREKKPNPLGLYHMLGNVAEWCASPDGEDDKQLKVCRGGHFLTPRYQCTPTWREERPDGRGNQLTGIRLVWNELGVRKP